MHILDAIIATVDCRNNRMQALDAVKYCYVMPLALACTNPHFLGTFTILNCGKQLRQGSVM
jgi:hypothetical protein